MLLAAAYLLYNRNQTDKIGPACGSPSRVMFFSFSGCNGLHHQYPFDYIIKPVLGFLHSSNPIFFTVYSKVYNLDCATLSPTHHLQLKNNILCWMGYEFVLNHVLFSCAFDEFFRFIVVFVLIHLGFYKIIPFQLFNEMSIDFFQRHRSVHQFSL